MGDTASAVLLSLWPVASGAVTSCGWSASSVARIRAWVSDPRRRFASSLANTSSANSASAGPNTARVPASACCWPSPGHGVSRQCRLQRQADSGAAPGRSHASAISFETMTGSEQASCPLSRHGHHETPPEPMTGELHRSRPRIDLNAGHDPMCPLAARRP